MSSRALVFITCLLPCLLLGSSAHAGFKNPFRKAAKETTASKPQAAASRLGRATGLQASLYPVETPMMQELRRIETLGPWAMSGPATKLAYKALDQGYKAGKEFERTDNVAKMDETYHCLFIIEKLRDLMQKNRYSQFLSWYGEKKVIETRQRLGVDQTQLIEQYHAMHPELPVPEDGDNGNIRTIMMPNGQLRRFNVDDNTSKVLSETKPKSK